MKTISILVPETAIPAAIVDPRYMFTAVNRFFEQEGKDPPFKVQLVGMTESVRLHDGLITIQPDLLLHEVIQTDLILIPAISGDLDEAIRKNKKMYPWIVDHYKRGSEVASLCIGAFLMASTGLLNGKSCSTHWLFAHDFRTRFPEINLVDDKVITEQNGLYSSGGATSYWTLLLYLVEKYTSRDKAIMASKFFLLDIGKNSQSTFMIFRGQRDHEDGEILRVQDYIEANFDEKITVDELSDEFGIARRTFERRFKKATNNTVVEYIQRVKIEAAKKQLEGGRKTINEVMYEVGYTDTKAFREVFKKYTAMSPVDYRNKYTRPAI